MSANVHSDWGPIFPPKPFLPETQNRAMREAIWRWPGKKLIMCVSREKGGDTVRRGTARAWQPSPTVINTSLSCYCTLRYTLL